MYVNNKMSMQTQICIFSHNVQSNKNLIDNYLTQINSVSDLYLLQDIGIKGTRLLMSQENLNNRNVIINTSTINKSRSTAILVGKNWNIIEQWKNGNGSITAAIISCGNFFVAIASVYLPPGLDKFGLREGRLSKDSSVLQTTRLEAIQTYEELSTWIHGIPKGMYWIVGGDLNETRSTLDRKVILKAYTYNAQAKFVNSFLHTVQGVDVWRKLYPHGPAGYTRFKDNPARLDYFLIDKIWFNVMSPGIDFVIGNDNLSDHMFISLKIDLPQLHQKANPWSIRRPKVSQKIIDKSICNNICYDWKNLNGINWSFDKMNEFCTFVKSYIGDYYGWKGGNTQPKKSNIECANRRDLNTLRQLAAFVRTLSEQEDSCL
jgi:hypothetical protein